VCDCAAVAMFPPCPQKGCTAEHPTNCATSSRCRARLRLAVELKAYQYIQERAAHTGKMMGQHVTGPMS
jgi:hypothetical protein